MKEVTVILPFHRADKFLHSAIESIQSTHAVQVKLFLIDDRKEKNEDVFAKMSSIWTGGLGYGAALNKASGWISTEFVALMNSDDLVHEKRFSCQIEALRESDSCVSVTRLKKIEANKIPVFSIGGNKPIYDPSRYFFLFGSHLANASWLTKTDFWSSNMTFKDWTIGSDWLLGQELIKNHKFNYINEPLYYYRTHSNQVTSGNDVDSKFLANAWENLNSELGLGYVPKEIGTTIAFPRNRNLLPASFEEENLIQFQEWVSSVFELAQGDLVNIARPRIAYVSYLLWRNNPKLISVSPYISDIARIFLKKCVNSSTLRVFKQI